MKKFGPCRCRIEEYGCPNFLFFLARSGFGR
jgi:hypothetical protein